VIDDQTRQTKTGTRGQSSIGVGSVGHEGLLRWRSGSSTAPVGGARKLNTFGGEK
jgi:hypothetical protein